ncbi:hypothetical protein BKA57DRAFT_477693 [Linnemannia elongata]|nr:hypothetical protein BKA57DRAFT_477693 [Linnemannia elongata]
MMQLRSLVLTSLTTHLVLPTLSLLRKKRAEGLAHIFHSGCLSTSSLLLFPWWSTNKQVFGRRCLSSLELRWRGKDNLDNSAFNYLHTSIFKLHSLTPLPSVLVLMHTYGSDHVPFSKCSLEFLILAC